MMLSPYGLLAKLAWICLAFGSTSQALEQQHQGFIRSESVKQRNKQEQWLVRSEGSTSPKDLEDVKLVNSNLPKLAELFNGMQSFEQDHEGQIHAPGSSSSMGPQSKDHKPIVPHPQEAFVYSGSALLEDQWQRTVSPPQLPHILHVSCKHKGEFSSSSSWMTKNPGWSIDFLTDERIEDLFKSHFPTKALEQVAKAGVEKADIGRLLALEAEGGVYVDNDVEDLVPIDQWPERFHYQNKDIDVILGIEFPYNPLQMGLPTDANPLQITNWAMAAKPGNSIVRHAIEKIVEEAPGIPDIQANIISRTGPGALTSAVLQALSGYGLKLPNISEFNAGQGHLFQVQEKDGHSNNLLILPYRAFGFPGGGRSDLVSNPYADHLVKHMFAGSWKGGSDLPK